MTAHQVLEGPVREIKRTIDDLVETQPGLHVSVLITAPDGEGDTAATFFSTGDLWNAANILRRVIIAEKDRRATQVTPEAG